MNNAEHEAYVFASELRERERNARLAFTQTLRERLEAERVPIGASWNRRSRKPVEVANSSCRRREPRRRGRGLPLSVRCAGTKRDGTACTATVEPPQRFCWWHDPANADKRLRAASKAGKAKPSRELASIKTSLSNLADDVLEGRQDKGVAALASQVLNRYLRAVSVELKVNEQLELSERLEALEEVLKGRRPG